MILFIVPCIFLIIAYKHSIAIDASGKQITEASARMQELIDRVELLEKQVSQPSVVMTTHGDELKDLMRAVSETMNLMNSELNDLRKRIHSFDEVELEMTEEMAIKEAERCLSCNICSLCNQCVDSCEDY